MSLIPCTNWTEKSAAFQAAANAIALEMGKTKFAPGDPFPQKVADIAAVVASQVAAASQSGAATIEMCNLLDAHLNTLRALGQQLAQKTGSNDVTKIYLEPYESNMFSTLLAIAVAGVAGYWLYKWVTEKELYPRHLVPQYAGGHRRGGR